MNWKRIILASLVIWIFGTIWTFLTCGWLFNWVYQIPPLIWKGPESIMMPANMIGSNVLGILIAVIFSAVFALLYSGIPKKGVQKGLVYGFIIWLVGTFSGIVTLPFYMTIAPTVVVYWIINGLVSNLVMGAIAGAMYKEK